MDFANLLPLSSLLNDTLNSQLSLKVGEQGLTIPLPSSSKRPRITTIDKWLDAFAIFFSALVSAHPSRASDLIAYQQLIRDAARKFPGMAWYMYDVEFRRRASHNLSLKWGERDVVNHLQALAVPPESTPEYLSHHTPPTPINIPQLAFYLQGYPNQATVHHLLDGFSQGFKIGYSGPRGPKEYSNLPCAKKNPSIIDTMLKEVTLGHTAGPFYSPPFPNLQVYPIEAIPKKHSLEWRTIFHLSYPKHHPTSVNAHIPPEAYSFHYIKVDNAISILQELGQGCFMSKLDIKSAFRNIPVHLSDWELLGMKWEGLYFFDMVLPFGLRSTHLIFYQFSSAIEWIIQHKLNIPRVIHILDDFFLATSLQELIA